jgi:hypothetical protein
MLDAAFDAGYCQALRDEMSGGVKQSTAYSAPIDEEIYDNYADE